MAASQLVPAHDQLTVHRYIIRYPAHEPRDHDPHRHDFLEWKRRRKASGAWHCDFAALHRHGDTSECDLSRPLEAHHKVVELAMLNEISFDLLEDDFPGISAQSAGAWIDSDANLTLLCASHHRGPGGVHVASYSDFSSEYYIRRLITGAPRQ
jgi:hypothetical protein